MSKRQVVEPTSLEYGMLVFLKREDRLFPQTKGKGPYIVLGYTDNLKRTITLINPKT